LQKRLGQSPQAIDIVLIDAALPEQNAPELVQALRGANPELCCCFLSGRAADVSDDELCQLGGVRVFTRPFQVAEIAEQLRLAVAGEEALPPPAAPEQQPEARAAPDDIAEPPGDERRVSVRYCCNLENECQPLGQSRSGVSWQGRIVNLSIGGMRMLLTRRFEVGTVLVFSVRTPSGESMQRLLARVVRVLQEPDQLWSLGCSFTNPLADHDLRDLLGSATYAFVGRG
jgi:CheY-like chemotaxis protein